jgi:hypothetical protein
MKNTSVQWIALLGLAFLMMLAGACVEDGAIEPEEAAPEVAGDPASPEHHPFHVAVFDHVPTEAELQAELAELLAAGASSQVNPGGWQQPAAGQKLVRIDAVTPNFSDAGTNSTGVRFVGWWNRDGSPTTSETFVLDNPALDDLNRNTVSVFYYLINVGNIADQFVQGQISNTGSDGWYCDTLSLAETNHHGSQRLQSLPFRQWVDFPSPITSALIPANDSAWLWY